MVPESRYSVFPPSSNGPICQEDNDDEDGDEEEVVV